MDGSLDLGIDRQGHKNKRSKSSTSRKQYINYLRLKHLFTENELLESYFWVMHGFLQAFPENCDGVQEYRSQGHYNEILLTLEDQ